ncbi:hypothetical protein KUA24_76 [Vibrio phage HNL01]|nr:hypothetical protein KUA24_76 [Vibrio phage HNL01]
MPVKASQFTLVDRRDVGNTHQVVAVDPANYNLTRIPVSQFRGASNFVSSNAPTPVPEDPTILEYVDGDTFHHITEDGIIYYKWDNVNSRWANRTKLNGIRLLTAIDFPDEVNLDLRDTNFQSNIAFEDDYYLNKTIDILFKYSTVFGFNFSANNFQSYQGFRAPITFTYQGTDVEGYLNPSIYFNRLLSETAPELQVKRAQYRFPVYGDYVKIEIEGDEGHGGWFWRFDNTLAATNPSNLGDTYNEFLGVNITDYPLAAGRSHFREPKTWNLDTAPVQNDKKYREGDNVLDTSKGVLYYGYVEGLPANTTDLGLLFQGQTILAGSSLKTSKNPTGEWVSPTANDSEYQNGDYIFTADKGTPRIHGEYTFGSGSDIEAWPLFAVLRTPVKHKYNYGDNLPETYAGDYPVRTDDQGNDIMIVDGDVLEVYYSADKSYLYLGSASVGIGKDVADKTITWDLSTRTPLHNYKIKTSNTVGAPSVDNDLYYDGELVRNANGDVFKYIEDFVGDGGVPVTYNHRFELQKGLRAKATHVVSVDSVPALAWGYTPSTDNNSTEWGGATVQDNDELEVRFTNGIILIYTADLNEVTNQISWGDYAYKRGKDFTQLADDFLPATDNTKYRHGDSIRTSDFGLFFYDTTLNTNSGGWVFQGVDRNVEKFDLGSIVNTYNPQPSDPVKRPTVLVGTDNVYCKVGDEFIGTVSGTTTNKRIGWRVDSIDADGLVSLTKFNPNGVRVFVEPASNTGRPNLNDNDYYEGDFIDSPNTKWRYGGYVEGKVTNAEAWPDFVELVQTTEITDTTLSLVYNIKADNNLFYFEEKA